MIMKTLAIRDWARTGFHNMAADSSAMELVRSGAAEAVFRTYTWEPHCLSLGRFQDPCREADLNRLRRDGYHMVKRPTGGRAVWHGDELTYSLVIGERHPMVSGGTSESLRNVAGILLEALRASGVPAELNRTERELTHRGRKHNPCFTSHGRWEIVTPDGRKMVGSAQARRGGVFLEHGSILFTNQQHMAAEYLPVEEEERERMRTLMNGAAGTVKEYGADLSRETLAEALHRSFASSVESVPGVFSSDDLPGLTEGVMERRRYFESSQKT